MALRSLINPDSFKINRCHVTVGSCFKILFCAPCSSLVLKIETLYITFLKDHNLYCSDYSVWTNDSDGVSGAKLAGSHLWWVRNHCQTLATQFLSVMAKRDSHELVGAVRYKSLV